MKVKKNITGILTDLELTQDCMGDMPIDEKVCKIDRKNLLDLIRALKEKGIWHLTAITAVQDEDQIVLLYHLWLYGGLTVQVSLSGEKPCIETITDLIPGAAFHEREIQELFGVEFQGLARQELLFLSDDWQKAPPMLTQIHTSINNADETADREDDS